MTTSVEQQVMEETRRFRADLPRWLRLYRNKWVVFKNGDVVAAFDEQDDAIGDAVARYGRRGGGFIIAQVTEDVAEPVPISPALFLVPSAP